MSDDLVKRLRDLGDHASFEPHMHHTAADRIEELEAKLAQMQRTLDCAEDRAKYYREGREMMGHKWAKAEDGRAKAIEAMERAVALALEECPFREGTPSYNNWWYNRRTTIAELTGGKDE